MLQLTRNGIAGSFDLEAMRAEFDANRALRLPGLLAGDLLAKVHRRLELGQWIEDVHPGISRELVLRDRPGWQMLHFLASSPGMLAVVRGISGSPEISNFRGRVYRMLPGSENRIRWHDDLSELHGRIVGISVNLGPLPYSGGTFQLRRHGSRRLICELPNVGPGDAILFRISPELKHRVTPVLGTEPKTSFAGWFRSTGTDFVDSIKHDQAFFAR
jgi:hypothetical protein